MDLSRFQNSLSQSFLKRTLASTKTDKKLAVNNSSASENTSGSRTYRMVDAKGEKIDLSASLDMLALQNKIQTGNLQFNNVAKNYDVSSYNTPEDKTMQENYAKAQAQIEQKDKELELKFDNMFNPVND